MVSSDPHAWLRPIYRELAAEGAFEQLAPVVQYKRLMEAAAAVSKSGAALLLQSSPAAQVALLGDLAMMEAQRPLDPSEELWRVRRVHGNWSASPSTWRTASICGSWRMAIYEGRGFIVSQKP